jgi:rubrerythrin
MGIGQTHKAKETTQILEVNLKDEKAAIDFYKSIYKKVIENKEKLQYVFETLEHEIRHVVIEEEQHVAELSVLLGK